MLSIVKECSELLFLDNYVGLYNLDAVPETFVQASFTDLVDRERESGGR